MKAPAGVVPEFGGLEVTTSSTALQALTDAVLYLVAYPFECAEQLSSRVLAVAALRDVLVAFQAEGLPKPEEIEAAVKRDVDRLRALQNDDGGFGFWRRGDESWPYVSIHVAHALARAKAKGFPVPDDTLDRSRRYLREIDRHIPAEYGQDVRRTLQAYALSVRALLGDGDPARARALVREAGVQGLSFEALGWVLPVLSKDAASSAEVAAIRRRLANSVSETAAAAHFAVSYGDGAYLLLHSDRRADAILLEALIADQPGSDLIPKLVEGLLAHRKAGRWANTQENVFVLLALDRYFQAYEKTTPDFVARAWLGERYAGAHEFRGRTTERHHLAIPMPDLREGKGATDLLLAKEGAGRLYYRIGLRYAPDSLVLDPLDRGFTVERSYEGVDDPKDVQRADDGTWRIRAGARVRVRLTMVAPSQAVPRRARRSAARRPRAAEPRPRRDRHRAGRRRQRRDADRRSRPRRPAPPRALVVVVAALVRPPEPARRPRGGVLRPAVGGRPHLPLRRAGHDPGHVRRPAPEGRGDVRPRDLRPRRDRPGHRRVGRPPWSSHACRPPPVVLAFVLGLAASSAPAQGAPPRLKVSENRRFLVYEDGRPFFYLGDTAWELFHRLNREEADRYLQDRARKGFTVIQAVALAELDGLDDPNPYGHLPLLDNDPAPAGRRRRARPTTTGTTWTSSSRGPTRSGSTSASCPRGATSGTRSGARAPRSSPPRTRPPTGSGSGGATATAGSSGSSAATGRWRPRPTRRSCGRWRAACARATAGPT